MIPRHIHDGDDDGDEEDGGGGGGAEHPANSEEIAASLFD